MYTQCPECLSVFSLDAQTLAKAHGYVVCGHCEAGFDSLATLAEQLPSEPFVELPLNQPSLVPATAGGAGGHRNIHGSERRRGQ
jgi:predicted Zn finger-like uncharacterized protein